ncbi:hypothetical protein V6N11_031890 [Hibiscus sabdariffa]|uniref:Uncharacterized protein n=1 Tax=Hibiscus sabdariffa TaxID=183260 RepID=A0ABR2SZ09_9ROSI
MLDCVAVEDKSKSQGFVAGNFDLSHSSSRKQVLVAGDGARDSVLTGSLDLSNFPTLSEAQKGVENGNGNGSGDGTVSNWNLLDQSLKFFLLWRRTSPTISVFQRTADRLWGRVVGKDMVQGVDVIIGNDSSKFESCSGFGVGMESVVFPRICGVNVVLQSEGSVPVVEGDLVVSSSVAKEVDAVKVVGSSSNDVGVAVVGSFGVGYGSGQLASSNRFDALCSGAKGHEAPVVSP